MFCVLAAALHTLIKFQVRYKFYPGKSTHVKQKFATGAEKLQLGSV